MYVGAYLVGFGAFDAPIEVSSKVLWSLGTYGIPLKLLENEFFKNKMYNLNIIS